MSSLPKVFISHKFRTDSSIARRVRSILEKRRLSGYLAGSPEANPPWESIRLRIWESCALFAIFGKEMSPKVLNEVGIAWGSGIPVYAIADETVNYDMGIAKIITSYSQFPFKNDDKLKVETRSIARTIRNDYDRIVTELRTIRRNLVSKIGREPTIAEIAFEVRRPVELIRKIPFVVPSEDQYRTLGQKTRANEMLSDLTKVLKGMRVDCEPLTNLQYGVRACETSKIRGRRWTAIFYFLIFPHNLDKRFVFSRNNLEIERGRRIVIVGIAYGKASLTPIRSFMERWGGDLNLMPNISVCVDYFGPGLGCKYHDWDAINATTFLAYNVKNADSIKERIDDILVWLNSNYKIAFPTIVE